jgi:pimeloyl-ACP methyl ester carboxylesterase
VDTSFMRRLVEHWQTTFGWRAQERHLNELPQFLVDLDGVQLHFAALAAGRPALLLLHGWPGTCFEFARLMPLVAPEYDVVSVSLPGYGFSEKPTEPGMGPRRTAELVDSLMARLGHERYAVHASGLGTLVGLALAKTGRVTALHLGSDVPRFDTGRSIVHAYGPQTVGIALDDSPAGLAAWIADRWTNPEETLDDLLTIASIYWFTRSAASAARSYFEARAEAEEQNDLPSRSTATVVSQAVAGGPPEVLASELCAFLRDASA